VAFGRLLKITLHNDFLSVSALLNVKMIDVFMFTVYPVLEAQLLC